MDSIIFHIDVNSAYLSWTSAQALRDGETIDYRQIPAIIGGDETKRRGVVLARSEIAKSMGVKTGEPIAFALTKCPDLVMLEPDYQLYIDSSDSMLQILREYTDLVERYSIDEAFCDMSEYEDNYMEMAGLISTRIKEELGFTVNIGIGENRLLAKMASDFEKPDKIHTLFKSEIEEKLWPLDVGELFMVGPKTKSRLNSRGIMTIGDLARTDKDYIYSWLKKHGRTIYNYAHGIGSNVVKSNRDEIKSIGNSTTTSVDITTRKEALEFIDRLSQVVSMRVKNHNVMAATVEIALKDNNFKTRNRQTGFENYIYTYDDIYYAAVVLFDQLWQYEPIRLFSVTVTDLVSKDRHQISMFDLNLSESEDTELKEDRLQSLFGSKVVKRATMHD